MAHAAVMLALRSGAFTAMKNRCLPCYLIVRNVLILLAATAGLVYVSAEMQTRANQPNHEALALRQMFVYQLLSRLDPN
jgi:hypothetical protein